mgnify:CR=1 FL=1
MLKISTSILAAQNRSDSIIKLNQTNTDYIHIDIMDGNFVPNEQFKKEWMTHSQYGFSLCMAHGLKTVAKMIAAHHARTDWGAIIDLNQKDLEPYVYLLHHIDDLSAKFGKINISQC